MVRTSEGNSSDIYAIDGLTFNYLADEGTGFNNTVLPVKLGATLIKCVDPLCPICGNCIELDCDECGDCGKCWCCECDIKTIYMMCDCRHGIKCAVCIEVDCDCKCVLPVKIGRTEYLAGSGNRLRIVDIDTAGLPSTDDLWLVVIYGTVTTNFSFIVKADREVELFYQSSVISITVRLTDGIPKNLGGAGNSGFIYGSDRVSWADAATVPVKKDTPVIPHDHPPSEDCICPVRSYGMCECKYGMKCGVCTELTGRMVCTCTCKDPVKINGTEYLAGSGNRSRTVTIDWAGHPAPEDLWLVVIYGTVATNFSFVTKADREVELFYQTNVTSVTVRLTDGIPNNIGGGGHSGFIFGTDRVVR